MTTLRLRQGLQKQIHLSWQQLTSSMNKISADCQVRPNQLGDVFDFDHEEGKHIKVQIKPVVFRVKELAKSGQSNLFVTVEGRLNFAVDRPLADPLACHFSTEVGYFRIAGKSVNHILGLHYDFDDRTSMHPVYHVQLTSMAKHLDAIKAQYDASYDMPPELDQMRAVSHKVRVPTAHMDPLAVFIQLLADHLLNVNSGAVAQKAFSDARDAAMFFRSDPRQAQRLDHVLQSTCFRGPRWYP